MEQKDPKLPQSPEQEAPEARRPEAPKPKSQWQATKEGWYEKVPLSLKQLDLIVALGIAGLVILAIVIALDATGVF